MAGLVASIAAARHGVNVVLMHDRPVLGGNASSECRIHICGADRHNQIANMRETGILEEIRLENLNCNPNRNYSVWDMVLYDLAERTENLTVLLNCSCTNAVMNGDHIESVSGWQTTSQIRHKVRALIFADCSGDSVLAPLTGAEYRMGREGHDETGESIAPEKADTATMGMTCLFQARNYGTPQTFKPPQWANTYARDEDLPYGAGGHNHGGWWGLGYWWVELGGTCHPIHDTERIRRDLLKIVLGVWDHIKNQGDHGAENWGLEWLQFLPGKRESRRYIGDHVLTQHDIEKGGDFTDTVAYGGWSMDDHHPAGFEAVRIGAPATIYHPAPSPYGIPYRSLYSCNVDNLMFAGRNVSVTHTALSSTRVMGTCISMGQAIGTAAAIAIHHSLTPRDVGNRVRELQQLLLLDDCYLPRIPQEFSALTMKARLIASNGADPEPVRDGWNRSIGDDPHAWTSRLGDSIAYLFNTPAHVAEVKLLLDTAMDRDLALSLHYKNHGMTHIPKETPRRFRIDLLQDGEWRKLHTVEGNYQRQVHVAIGEIIDGVRYTLIATHGAKKSRVYGFYIL
ncbi:MAG: FAD-dependent oxidoreductase [Promethearchaeota archaeon]